MRIALVCGPFQVGWGYQENFWAEELSRAGHVVRVFCAADGAETLTEIERAGCRYDLHAVPTRQLPHRVLFCARLAEAVARFQANLILWFNVEDFFGRALVRREAGVNAPIVTFLGMNRGMHEFDWRESGLSLKQRGHALVWRFLRGPRIVEACRHSALVVCIVPETRDILDRLLVRAAEREAIRERVVHVPLGFSPRVYEYDPAKAREMRRRLGIASTDVVVCFSCRFFAAWKEARNRRTLSGVRAALQARPSLRAVLVGFGEDAISTRLRQFVEADLAGARVSCLPFADQEGLSEVYHASDFAIFPNASISCQAALGSGLIVCLANNGTMDHLIRLSSQAIFFDPNRPEDLADQLIRLTDSLAGQSLEEREARRREWAGASRWLGYDRLAASVINRVGQIAG